MPDAPNTENGSTDFWNNPPALLRMLVGVVVAVWLGLIVLGHFRATLDQNCPNAIPSRTAKMEVVAVPKAEATKPGQEKGKQGGEHTNWDSRVIEEISPAPQVWALGITLTAELGALVTVLYAACRIARNE